MKKCEENIKFIIPKPITPIIKPPRYHSIFTESVKRRFNSIKDCHRTMGYAKVHLDPPSQFLKKNTRKVIRPSVEKVKCDKSLPRIPKQAPPSEPKPKKNIIAQNIIDISRVAPSLSKKQIQDTRDGHVIVVIPNYVGSKNYGKTPNYIIKIHKEKELARKKEEERIRQIKPPLRLVPKEEREALINGLKTNWGELHKEFLLLPVYTDTIQKIKRKNNLDKELRSLEKDIEMLERNVPLYVEN
ncbi:Enkurin domain [Cinara cedri]|uniref:Enkurin domain n=1 Tax=Cinara cedri TaxID=506608 RepID=A0A5E4N5B4_9HEMI|nr:Enkurin domain [Cinara cedri]